MNNQLQGLNKTTATIILVVIIGVILAGGVYLLKNYQPQNTSKGDVSGDLNANLMSININTADWIQIPYYSEILNFSFSYPSDWHISEASDPANLYDGQYLVWIPDSDDYSTGINSLGIYLHNDTGDDLDTWVEKKSQTLQSEKGYLPNKRELIKQNERFIELCFLGHPDYSPMPVCYMFMHHEPYIIELKADGSTRDFPADKYLHTFFSKFTLLDGMTEGWGTYISSNAGFQIDYPEGKYPPTDDNSQFGVSFTKDYIGPFMVINVHTGLEEDVGQYWYQKISGFSKKYVETPRDIYIDGQKCLLANFDGVSYEGVINPTEAYCAVNDRIYEIIINPDQDKGIDVDLFTMLGTMKFLDEIKADSGKYLFRFEVPGFQLIYPQEIRVIETREAPGNYYSFEEDTHDGLNWKRFSISFQETSLSVEECIEEESCLLWGDLTNYHSSQLAGIDVLEYRYQDDLYDLMADQRNIIFKRNGYIFQLTVTTSVSGNNDLINDMLSSFQFID